MIAPLWYSSITEVDAYANASGDTAWINTMEPKKKFILEWSTELMEGYHKIPRKNNMPWKLYDQDLRLAGMWLALWVARVIDELLGVDKIKVLTNGNYSDTTMSVDKPTEVPIPERIKLLIDSVMGGLGSNRRRGVYGRS